MQTATRKDKAHLERISEIRPRSYLDDRAYPWLNRLVAVSPSAAGADRTWM